MTWKKQFEDKGRLVTSRKENAMSLVKLKKGNVLMSENKKSL